MATRQARRRQQRVAQRSGKPIRRGTPWYLSWQGLAGAVAIIVLVVVAFAIIGNNGANGSVGDDALILKPAPASVLSKVENTSPSVINKVKAGPIAQPWQVINGKALTHAGKPELLYIGGEYCPYCAGERWALINAVSRFGKISGLRLMTSTAGDVWPSTPTFTTRNAKYTSPYLNFVFREESNRAENAFQKLTSQESSIYTKFDPKLPGGGGIPFVDLNNQAITSIPPGYNVGILHTHPLNENAKGSLKWETIANDLTVPTTPQAQAIVGEGNWLTAGICKLTNNKPTSACGSPVIQHMESKIKLGK